MGKKQIKKRALQIIITCICISQLQFLGEVAAKENNLVNISEPYGPYFEKDINEPQETQEETETPQEEDTGDEAVLKEPEIVEEVAPAQAKQEIIEERTPTSRTYRLADGSYLSEQFFEPIYQEKEGTLEAINDTLESDISLFSEEQQFHNEDGLLEVSMNETTVTIDDLHVSYPQSDLSRPVVKNNAILYNDIAAHQDMQITVRSDKVFQEIKYEERPEAAVFMMEIQTPYEVRQNGNALIFEDEKGNEKAIWKAPVLEDKQHRLSLDVTTEIEETKDGYLITYTGDDTFFNDETVYPVKLASTYDANTQIDVDSGYIRSGSPYQTSNYDHLFVGYDTDGRVSGLGDASIIANARTFIDFTMPDIGKNQLITSASLILYKKSDYTIWEMPSIEVYDTNGKVDPNTVNWNNQPGNVTYISSTGGLAGFGDKSFDITTIIDSMYHGKSTSIMLKSSVENDDNYLPSVFASESTGSRPRVQIAHRDDYDVDPDIGINDFQAKFRFYTTGYNDFKGFSIDGIAKPYGKVHIQLQEKQVNTTNAISGKLTTLSPGAYFIHPIFQDQPLSGVQRYPDEDVNYTSDYFTRSYFPSADTMYTFQIWPSIGNETGTKYDTDSFLFYKVKLGDNLKTIAAHYDTTVERIKQDNNTNEDIVKQGDELLIRYPKELPALSKEVYTPPIRISSYEAKFKYRGPACYGHCFEGDPINTSTGNFYHETTDFTLQDFDTIEFKRTYNSVGNNTSIFGDGFNTPFEQYIGYDASNNIVYFAGDGKIIRFPYNNGKYGNSEEHTIRVNDHIVQITNTTTKETMTFDIYGMLTSITDKQGNAITIQYDDDAKITSVQAGTKTLTFEYYPDKRLVKAIHLPSGHKVQYEYNDHKLTRFIDAKGESETYTYDSNGRISAITDMAGNTIARNTYDGEGKVTSQKDGKGQETTIRYNSDSATITYSDGTMKTYKHNSDYKVNTIIDENNETSRYTYQNNRMTSKSDASGTTRYEYNSAGSLMKQTNPDQTTIEYTYDNDQNLLSKKAENGQTETYTYDSSQNPITKTDRDGNTTTYVYDGDHRVIKETDAYGVWKSYTYEGKQIKTITHMNGLVITYTYDDNGNLIQERDSNGRVTSYQYDANNRVIRKTDPLNNSEEYAYDGRGNVITHVGTNGAVTNFTYDANNNLIQTTTGDLTMKKTYDAKNRMIEEIDEQGRSTRYVYDGAGKKIKSIDTYGQETQYHYNAQGDLIETIDPKGNRTKEEYDQGHRRIVMTDPYGNETHYTYDEAGQLLETKQPNGKTTTATYEHHKQVATSDEFGNITEMAYDDHGRMIKKIDATGNISEMTYDVYGNIHTKSENGEVTTYEYDVYGNVIKETDPKGNTTIKTYDPLNRVTTETDALDQSIRHIYDAVGNEIETIDKAGYSVKKEYDLLGRCTKEIDENGNETTYAYNDKNQNTMAVKGDTKTEFIYDSHGDMVETKVNGITIKEVVYDAYGRAIKESTPTEVISYEYDSFDRIIQEHNETTKRSPKNMIIFLISSKKATAKEKKRRIPMMTTIA